MTDAIAVWGEVLWDRFPDGDQLGGAPANVAWHIGQAGGWAQLISRVGDDADGRRALEQLDEVIDVELVQVDPERATGEVTVELHGGEPRYTLVSGRAWERIACTPATARALQLAGVLVYGTLAQRTPEGLAAWRAAIASTRGTKVCDLNLRRGATGYLVGAAHEAIREAIAAADLLKVNDGELAALATWFGWGDPIAALRAGRRDRLVAVTHGAAGSTLYTATGTLAIPGIAAAAGGDNVGCGDAYLALLVHGLAAGWDLAASGHAAARWAAAVAEHRGATPRFSRAQIAELLP
jgi:fructokinase